MFCWKWHHNRPLFESALLHLCSFNPCFAGSGIITQECPICGDLVLMFQSLFCWKWHHNLSLSHFSGRIFHSFNPCFAGSGIITAVSFFTSLSILRCFNPCFAGSGIITPWLCHIVLRDLMFQSLFCWKWHHNSGDVLEILHCPGVFQSLFCWKWHHNHRLCRVRASQSVSILVLLEVAS